MKREVKNLAGMRIKASYIGLKKEIISQKGRWYLAVIIDKERVQESSAEDRRALEEANLGNERDENNLERLTVKC